jgi:hypothetical protein
MSTERRRGDDADFARACARERERERERKRSKTRDAINSSHSNEITRRLAAISCVSGNSLAAPFSRRRLLVAVETSAGCVLAEPLYQLNIVISTA